MKTLFLILALLNAQVVLAGGTDRIVEKTETESFMTDTTVTDTISMDGAVSIAVQAVVDVNTPAAKSFATTDVTVAADTITETGHGYPTGLKGQFTTTGTLPAGLSTSTDYFVIDVDDDTYQVAASLANAQAGTQVTITDQGSGTHTFTPTAIAGATVALQKSNDKVNWDAVATATNITADANVWLEDDAPGYRWARIRYTITAGSMSADNHILVKGD